MVPPFSVKMPMSAVSILIFQAGSFKKEARLSLFKNARLASVRLLLRRKDLRCIRFSFSNTILMQKIKDFVWQFFFSFFRALKCEGVNPVTFLNCEDKWATLL